MYLGHVVGCIFSLGTADPSLFISVIVPDKELEKNIPELLPNILLNKLSVAILSYFYMKSKESIH